MKIFLNLLIVAVGATIGFAVGLALKGKSPWVSNTATVRHMNEAGSGFSTNPQFKSSFTAANRGVIRKDDSPLATKLAEDLSMSSGVTRWLYWLEALEKATPGDCARLAEMAKGNSPLLRLVASRWVEMDPQHMLNTLLTRQGGGFPTDELQRVLFEEWPKRDMEAAIAALSKKEGSAVPVSWRRSFATTLVEKDPERGLRLMSEWNIENHGPRMTGVKKWAAANPRHAAEFALANPAGYASRMVMDTVGKEWARTDPAAALEFASSKRGELSSILAGSVLKAWTDRNLSEATDWLSKTDAATRNRLSPSFVEGWAKYDAESALKWSEANLTGITFANAAAGVVKGFVDRDLMGAAELVKTMTPSRARGDAATIVLQKWMPNVDAKQGMPSEAMAWLAKLDSESIKHVLDQHQWRWADADAKSLKAFVSSLKPEDVSPNTYSTLARSLARQNPVEALEWAKQLPGRENMQAGYEALSEWQRSQPAAAQEWVRALDPKDPRREPFFAGVVSTIVNSPGGTEQLAAMTGAEKNTARALIEKMSIPEERRSALLGALQTP
jgi:hypothetical protein